MKKRIAMLLAISLCCLSACGGSKASLNQSESEVENLIPAAGTETESSDLDDIIEQMEFVDAHGEKHLLTIQKDWKLKTFQTEGFQIQDGKMTYQSQSGENIGYRLGVDVSRYNGSIQWDKVKAAGYDFAYVRIGFRGYGSSGSLKEDTRAVDNIKGALKAGLDVGVYFFSQAINEEEAIEEANFTLEILEKAGVSAEDLALPIVFDPESILGDEARTDNVTGQQFTENALAFFGTIEEAGYQGMIYSNLIWESEMLDLGILKDYPIWYADYEAQPQTPYDFEFWQYTESGSVDGIPDAVDINIQLIK